METNWTEVGFLGSILLFFYGMIAFIAFYLPPNALGLGGTLALTGFLGVLAIVGGLLVSFGFLAFSVEYGVGWMWFLVIWGIFAWTLQGAGYLTLALLLPIGFILYYWATFALMFNFLFGGIMLLNLRHNLGRKARYALGVSFLLVINAIGWITHFGFLVLALVCILQAIIFVPTSHLSKFAFVLRLFTSKRLIKIGKIGVFFLSIYAFFLMRYLLAEYMAYSIVASAVLNFLALVFALLAVIGIAIVLNIYEKAHENRLMGYALMFSIPSLLMLSVGDFVWFISDLSYFINPTWRITLVQGIPYFLIWGSIPNAIWTILAAGGFLQIYRSPEAQGEPSYLMLHLIFLLSGIFWFFGFGYFLFIIGGFILQRGIDQQLAKVET